MTFVRTNDLMCLFFAVPSISCLFISKCILEMRWTFVVLLQDLIDIKSEEIKKAIDEQEEIGEEPGELVEEEEEHEEVDEIIDIVMEESPEASPVPPKRKETKVKF